MKRKILISLIALFSFFTIGALVAVYYMQNTTEELKQIIQLHEVEQLRRSLLINLRTVQIDLHTVNTPLAHELDLMIENVLQLEETSQKCTSCHHPPRLIERITNVQSLVKDYARHLSYYITGSANTERLQKLKMDAVQVGDKIVSLTEGMSHMATENLKESTNSTLQKITQVKKILVITLAITFFMGVLTARRLIKSVIKPVNKLVNATRMIASGKLGTTIDYRDKTEFGELAKYFNVMSTTIKEGYENIQKEIVERRQTEEALRESEEKLQSVFNHMQDVFFRTDKQEYITWVSPSAKVMLGHDTVEEIIGHDFKEFYPGGEKKLHFLKELSEKGRVTNYELEMLKHNGSTIIVSTNAHFYRSKDGEIMGIEGSWRDITERKIIEEDRIKIEKLESIGVVAGGIAHDFNNILTTIVGNISLVKMYEYPRSKFIEILVDAEKACMHAKRLTNALLTFSKGGVPIKEITYIEGILRDSASFALRGSNVKCVFFIPDKLWPVEVDVAQITQVFHNLIINANQAMPDGGTIEIFAENVTTADIQNMPLLYNRECIKVTVKDSGIGIPKEHFKKIFDPYFTTKREGSGLGLTGCYSIIKNHYGHIDVYSETGKGTVFHIFLPASRENTITEQKKSGKIFEGTGKILIMDDEENVRKTSCTMIRQLGYEVEGAKDGEEAIYLYKSAMESLRPFDAVIMDLTIRGGRGGKETIKKLLEIDPEVKAIVSSGYSHEDVMANFKEYGFRAVIAKPFDISELSIELKNLIKNKISL
jgi:PAS domain S-box-containing protein